MLPKIDFQLYQRLEDLSHTEIEMFRDIVVDFIEDITEYTDINVVGSYCFNLKNKIVNDIDIVVIVPESFHKIKFPCSKGTGYDLINKIAIAGYPYLNNTFNKKVQIFPMNKDSNDEYNIPFKGLDGTMLSRPYFNLLSLEWRNKVPYDYFPYAYIKGRWVYRGLVPSKSI